VPTEFGISNLIIRETASGIAKGDLKSVKGVWRWSFKATLIFSSSLMLILLISAILGSKYFTTIQIQTFYLGLALIPLHSFVHIISSQLRGMKKIILGQIPDLIIIPGLFVLIILIVHYVLPTNLSTVLTMSIRSITTFITLLICILLLRNKIPHSIRYSIPIQKGRQWFRSAIPLGLSSGLNMVRTRITILLMGIFVTAGDITTFQIAISTSAIASLALQAINSILAPQFASLYASKQVNQLERLVKLSARLTFVFNLTATLVFLLWGKSLLAFAFGDDLITAYPSTLILLTGQLLNSFVGSVAFLLNMTGHENHVMRVITISTGINIILTLIFTPLWGIIGATIANTTTLIFAQLAMYKYVAKTLGIKSHAF
jgi:O-antigen/teichoic acid export membrane protein